MTSRPVNRSKRRTAIGATPSPIPWLSRAARGSATRLRPSASWVAVATALLLNCCAGAAQASASAPGSVVFPCGYRSSDLTPLYCAVQADGRHLRHLAAGLARTYTSYSSGFPSFNAFRVSPDGGFIAGSIDLARQGYARVVITRADGTGRRIVAKHVKNDPSGPFADYGPNTLSWSRNGRWILFDTLGGPWVVRRDATGLRRALPLKSSPGGALSADGRSLLYQSHEGVFLTHTIGRYGHVLVVRNVYADSPYLGFPYPAESFPDASWSPSGRFYAALHLYDNGQGNSACSYRSAIWVNGHNVTPVNPAGTRLLGAPAWSLNGHYLAYNRVYLHFDSGGGDCSSLLYGKVTVMGRHGEKPHTVATSSGDSANPYWSNLRCGLSLGQARRAGGAFDVRLALHVDSCPVTLVARFSVGGQTQARFNLPAGDNRVRLGLSPQARSVLGRGRRVAVSITATARDPDGTIDHASRSTNLRG